jgi:hypothetical protein
MNDNCARKRIYVNQLEIDVFINTQHGMDKEQFISSRPILRRQGRPPVMPQSSASLQASVFTDIMGLLRGQRGQAIAQPANRRQREDRCEKSS